MKQFSKANIPICQQVRLFEIDAGGPSFTGCLEKGYQKSSNRYPNGVVYHDAETLIQYLSQRKKKIRVFILLMRQMTQVFS